MLRQGSCLDSFCAGGTHRTRKPHGRTKKRRRLSKSQTWLESTSWFASCCPRPTPLRTRTTKAKKALDNKPPPGVAALAAGVRPSTQCEEGGRCATHTPSYSTAIEDAAQRKPRLPPSRRTQTLTSPSCHTPCSRQPYGRSAKSKSYLPGLDCSLRCERAGTMTEQNLETRESDEQ